MVVVVGVVRVVVEFVGLKMVGGLGVLISARQLAEVSVAMVGPRQAQSVHLHACALMYV